MVSLSSPTSWDLSPHQYFFGDNLALNKINQHLLDCQHACEWACGLSVTVSVCDYVLDCMSASVCACVCVLVVRITECVSGCIVRCFALSLCCLGNCALQEILIIIINVCAWVHGCVHLFHRCMVGFTCCCTRLMLPQTLTGGGTL